MKLIIYSVVMVTGGGVLAAQSSTGQISCLKAFEKVLSTRGSECKEGREFLAEFLKATAGVLGTDSGHAAEAICADPVFRNETESTISEMVKDMCNPDNLR